MCWSHLGGATGGSGEANDLHPDGAPFALLLFANDPHLRSLQEKLGRWTEVCGSVKVFDKNEFCFADVYQPESSVGRLNKNPSLPCLAGGGGDDLAAEAADGGECGCGEDRKHEYQHQWPKTCHSRLDVA